MKLLTLSRISLIPTGGMESPNSILLKSPVAAEVALDKTAFLEVAARQNCLCLASCSAVNTPMPMPLVKSSTSGPGRVEPNCLGAEQGRSPGACLLYTSPSPRDS